MGFVRTSQLVNRRQLQYIPPGLAGITHIIGFGKRYPLATTESEAIQNLYNRINYNANWDANGDKKFIVYPTEIMSHSLVSKIVKAYRELVGTQKISSLNNINDKQQFNTITSKVADYAKVGLSTVTQVMTDFYYSVRSTKDISEEMLSPGFRTNPTAEQAASWRTQQEKAELIKKEEDLKNQDCGFFCKITNSAAGVVGAGETATKIMAIGIPTVMVGGVAGIIYVIARKVMSLDVNKAVSEQGKTNRAVAGSAGKAAEGYLKSKY